MAKDDKLSKLRILVIDDNLDSRVLAKTMLHDAGYTKVTTIEDPLVALARVQRGLADFVFLDWRMPKLPGIELLRIIRSNDRELPMVMLTNVTDREAVVQALHAGANDYIVKPFTTETLVAKIDEVINKKHEQEIEEEVA